MKSRKMIFISIAILLILVVPTGINLIYAWILNKNYPNITDYHSINYTLEKLPVEGRLQFVHTDLSADYVSFIYLDTLTLNFKVVTKSYVGNDNEETDYITFDQKGKILETDKFIPRQTDTDYYIDRETINADGKIIRSVKSMNRDSMDHYKNCITLNGVLPPWPKWKNKSSPVYIRHFSPRRLNLSDLNPFKIGGINGNAPSSVWYGFAYCDVKHNNEILKVKLPFGYNNLIFGSADYYADLQYYALPAKYAMTLPVGFLQLGNDIYIIRSK